MGQHLYIVRVAIYLVFYIQTSQIISKFSSHIQGGLVLASKVTFICRVQHACPASLEPDKNPPKNVFLKRRFFQFCLLKIFLCKY